jgi:hypothetical protein
MNHSANDNPEHAQSSDFAESGLPLDGLPQPGSMKEGAGRSTGPRTIQGKRISSRNALAHGFFAKEVMHDHLRRKDRGLFKKIFNGFIREQNPVGQSELAQIELMAMFLYQYVRLFRVATALRGGSISQLLTDSVTFTDKDSHEWLQALPDLEVFEKLQRCENHILRHFYRARAELERLQALRMGEKSPAHLTLDINS